MVRRLVDSRSAVSLVSASACWGVATVICKSLLSSVSPSTLLVIQLAPSVLVLWLFVLIGRLSMSSWRLLVPLSSLGILNPGIAYTLSLLGLRRTSVSVASLLWASEPLLIVGLGLLVLRERPSARLLGVVAAGACGATLVAGFSFGVPMQELDLLGVALILSGVLCCAFYTVLMRKIALGVEPLFTVSLQQTFGLLCALLLWHFDVGRTWYENIGSLPASDLIWGVVSGLLYYALAFWLYLRGLSQVAASVAGVFLNLIPVFCVGAAVVFLDEDLSDAQWFGAIMILGSVFALFSRRKRPVRLLQ